MNTTIHSFESIHLPECAALFLRVFNNAPWNESWQAETVSRRMDDCYKTPGFYGIISKTQHEIIGFCIGYVEHWDTSRHFYLKEICVATEYQRHGVGSALLDELENRLVKEGIKKIYLHTARDTVAQHFYEKRQYYISSRMIMMSKYLPAD